MSYAQGLAQLRLASTEYHYDIDPGRVAAVWRAGCIIRAALLSDVRDAFRRNPSLGNLLLDRTFADAVGSRQAGWRQAVQTAVGLGIPVPALGASLAYYDSYRSERLPANLVQAQRDFFGAHTYRRVDRPGSFHTEWTSR
jgi:6-phosphogluconate dehydrogenase